MSKAILDLGYASYVIDVKEAVVIADILNKAEIYERIWGTNANNHETVHHIYENDKEPGTIRLLPDNLYTMYKLAGKPVKGN